MDEPQAREWTVAWIWAAIAMATKPDAAVEWSDVVGAADAINHAIPSADEIELAVNSLAGAELLRIEGRQVFPRDALHAAYRRARSRARDGMFDVARRLVSDVSATTPGPGWRLPEGALDAAYWEYTRRINGLEARASSGYGFEEAYQRMVLRRARAFHPAVLSTLRMADKDIDEPDQQVWLGMIGQTVMALLHRGWITVGVCRPASHPRIERTLNMEEAREIFGVEQAWWEYETADRWVGIDCTPAGLAGLEELAADQP